MSTPVIESGIPIPFTPGISATLRSLAVGDSFLMPDEWKLTSLKSTMQTVGGKFALRKTPEGYRVWRLS